MRRPDVDRLLEEIGDEQFEEWMQFHEKHPLGPDRDRQILANGLYMIYRACGGSSDFDVNDFSFEPRDEVVREQSAEEQMAIMGQHAQILRNS